MAACPSQTIPIGGGRIEAYRWKAGGGGRPVVVLGGVETGFRPLAGTEQVLDRRWERRASGAPVIVIGRPLPDDPADAERIMHPRVIADAVATALTRTWRPSAGRDRGRVGRRTHRPVADGRPSGARRAPRARRRRRPRRRPTHRWRERMARWIELGEAGDWGTFFASMAQLMKAATEEESGSFAAAARLQPRPATPERFIGELKATLDPSSFVTGRLGEIAVPALVLAGELGPGRAARVDAARGRADPRGAAIPTRSAATRSAARSAATTTWSSRSWPRATRGATRSPRPGRGRGGRPGSEQHHPQDRDPGRRQERNRDGRGGGDHAHEHRPHAKREVDERAERPKRGAALGDR